MAMAARGWLALGGLLAVALLVAGFWACAPSGSDPVQQRAACQRLSTATPTAVLWAFDEGQTPRCQVLLATGVTQYWTWQGGAWVRTAPR